MDKSKGGDDSGNSDMSKGEFYYFIHEHSSELTMLLLL